jgi:hypothetical protein
MTAASLCAISCENVSDTAEQKGQPRAMPAAWNTPAAIAANATRLAGIRAEGRRGDDCITAL